MTMLRLGLTGGIASGKSAVAAMLRELGFSVLDADSLAHKLIEPGQPAYNEVLHEFGNARVDDGVQAVELGAIVEHDGAEFCAVDPPVRHGHGLSEFLQDLAVGGLARLDKFMRQGVRIEDGEAHFPEHGSNGAFAAGDSTGESKP